LLVILEDINDARSHKRKVGK